MVVGKLRRAPRNSKSSIWRAFSIRSHCRAMASPVSAAAFSPKTSSEASLPQMNRTQPPLILDRRSVSPELPTRRLTR